MPIFLKAKISLLRPWLGVALSLTFFCSQFSHFGFSVKHPDAFSIVTAISRSALRSNAVCAKGLWRQKIIDAEPGRSGDTCLVRRDELL